MEESVRVITRRGLLRTAGGLIVGLAAEELSYFAPSTAAAEESSESPLITRVARPYDAETPVHEFSSYLTPNEQFFVRSHFGPPPLEKVNPDTWRLRVAGLVDRPLVLRLDELKQFEEVSIIAVLQCSGNGRAFYEPKAPGVQWERGAVGNAKWTGVRLRDVLSRTEVQASARHLQMLGADRPVATTTPLFLRSIPVEKALHPDTILAYAMNDRPLPLLHGAPLRLITPGWMGDACVKWLTELTLQEEEAQGYYMQTAYRHPVRPVEPGSMIQPADMKPIEAMVVKSLIVRPGQGASVRQGSQMIQGVAWTGEGKILKIEISTDNGRTWTDAQLVGPDTPYAWRQWRFSWPIKESGSYTVLSRATDDRGHTQPMTSSWNPGGFLWNGVDRIQVEANT